MNKKEIEELKKEPATLKNIHKLLIKLLEKK